MEAAKGPPVDPELLADLLDRLAALMLSASGEGAETIAAVLDHVARAYGGRVAAQIVPDSATLSLTVGGAHHRTFVTTAFPEVARLDRLDRLRRLVEAICAGRVPLAEARERSIAITESPAPYPRLLRLSGIVLFAVGFAPAMQATWYEIGSTAVLAAVVAVLTGLTESAERMRLVLPLLAAIAVSVVTLLLFARNGSHGSAVLLMLPALFYFVPGDYLSAAVGEIVGGFLTTGAIRLVYAVVLLLQLYVGIVLGAALTGTPLSRFDDFAAAQQLPRWVLACTWAVFVVGTVLAFGIPMRLLGWVLLLAYLTLAVQEGLTRVFGDDGGTFVAAMVLAASAGLLSRPVGRPPRLLLLLAGFFTLTVGSLGLRGLTTLVGGHPIQGFRDLLDLVTLVTVIATGMLLGTVLVPVRERV